MFEIFREYIGYRVVYENDPNAFMLNLIGGILITITFFIFGMMALLIKPEDSHISKRRIAMTRLMGYFMVACAISRVVGVIAIWHNYAILDGWMKILTGVLCLAEIAMIPSLFKERRRESMLKETKATLEDTMKSLHQVKTISEKLDGNSKKE